jgi:hypothetical protein
MPMSKQLASILVCGALGSLFSLNVEAFPISSPLVEGTVPNVTLARSVCGLGFHRSTNGRCATNGAFLPPAYAPSDPGVQLACPTGYFHLFPYNGCFAPACTYGYYLGPDGQCFPYWRPGM